MKKYILSSQNVVNLYKLINRDVLLHISILNKIEVNENKQLIIITGDLEEIAFCENVGFMGIDVARRATD